MEINNDLFAGLNPAQREAVSHTEGPLLIRAGAGSGKTTVVCRRIANIINKGQALPWQILAVTFTNKAAAELRERLGKLVVNTNGGSVSDIWAGTFHSTCVKILRRGIEAAGYLKSFTIYDTDDSIRLIKACMKELCVSEKAFSAKSLFAAISRAKDKLIKPEDFETEVDGRRDFFLENAKEVYTLYQRRMKSANALDFDDLIMKTVEILESNSDIREKWQRQFRYITVDEYQDTNFAQYRLISLLAGKQGNLCVVGDEDQSIYRFRGATIENILSFEEEFRARVIKLEQNYRSTENILGAANGVIRKNTKRESKTLFSATPGGDKVQLHILDDEQDEAFFITREIEKGKGNGIAFGGNAVLYRTNAQSRVIELAMGRQSIPYRMVGGVRFYERKEIKDIIAYMSVIVNPFDLVRFRRIINEPKRSLGEATQAEIERLSVEMGMSPIDVMENASQFMSLQKKSVLLMRVAAMFNELSADAEGRDISNLIEDITEQTGYLKMLQSEGDEGLTRLENIRELKSAAVKFREENEGSSLFDFLENVSLVSDTDDYESAEDKVVLMTIHAAKGLEFERVFLVGAEEGMFPSYRSLADPMDVEEERRLAYVAITRAKRSLYITTAKQRLLYGETRRNAVSRFVREIPGEYIDENEKKRKSFVVDLTEKKKVGYLANASDSAKKKSIESAPAQAIVFADGERVKHKVFGEGTVIDVQRMGNDSLLEIAFDKAGTKKIMANFAKVERV
ncbi:MAG: UvrD-helicase domain-containing protein [Oscillospiraceae bacterium]|nr:UvrD-helicase domain-containing protein [Oscillospiraceae bacterium]